MRNFLAILVVWLLMLTGVGRAELPMAGRAAPLWARAAPGPADPGLACRRAIAVAGREAGVPDHLMAAIGRIESGRRGADGQINPWPWSINAEGIDHVFDTREEVLAAVRGLQAQGVRSIDVGCMQVNLLHHPNAFASLEQGFDPLTNARFAARFLVELHRQTQSWEKATAYYHSATPELGDPYQKKVASVLAEETQHDLQSLGVGTFAGARPPGAPAMGGLSAMAGRGLAGLRLPNRVEAPSAAPAGLARGLDSYRARPVQVVGRPRAGIG